MTSLLRFDAIKARLNLIEEAMTGGDADTPIAITATIANELIIVTWDDIDALFKYATKLEDELEALWRAIAKAHGSQAAQMVIDAREELDKMHLEADE